MTRATLFFLSLLILIKANAQPGGGGGLTIKNLYDKNLTPIELNSPELKIRNFVLNDNSVYEELYNFKPMHLMPSKWNYSSGREQSFDDQRLLIEYKSKIMIIDLLNIMQENGMGNSDYMDSLVITSGHFIANTNPNRNERNNDWQKNTAILNNGITPFTISLLKEPGLITYNINPDVSFLREENLTPHFILKRGVNSFRKENYNAAIADIQLSFKKGLNIREKEEALATLASCYSKKYDYETALELINEIIDSRSVDDNYRLMHYYKARIDIFTALKKYNLALNDYDYIIANTTEHQLVYIAEKAEFKRKYLSDCASSLQDFENIIINIPKEHLSDRPGGWSEYAETFFAYASLEYSCEQYDDAFSQWLKAMEFGYGQTSADYAVTTFDSIIELFANIPELYLSRAIANYKRAPYLGWGDETKNVLKKSVLDIDKAEELGMNDFRINLYRAQSLNLLKLNDDALNDINIAIKKNKNDPRSYAVRYRILSDLGKTTWGKDHPDLVKYRELCKRWNFSSK